MPCLERNWKNSVSLFAGISIWSANLGMLCHLLSLRMSKKFSMSKVVLTDVSVNLYLSQSEPLVELQLVCASVFFGRFL